VVTISEFSRSGISEMFGIEKENIYVVNGASDPVFRVVENPAFPVYLKEHGLNRSKRLVSYVGGFGPHKNVGALVDSFAELIKEERFLDVFLVLVGEYEKETYYSVYPELLDQVKKLGLQDRVIFTGYIPDEDLVHLLNISTVLVLPSLIEGLGLPALEAAACGCPVIATCESPLPDMLGKAGIYIDPDSPSQITGALSDILGSEELRADMARHASQVSSQLKWQDSARQMKVIIKTVVSQ
jgi:glycosyltransferase involved in cell wall biosynthesis